MNQSLERPALYYPYIHIRSEHWLKATLLCTPVIKRIVPDDYTPEDLPGIRRYSQISGPWGGLLQTVPAWSSAADAAQQRLLEKLREHESEISARYNRAQAPPRDEYWIHDAKFSDGLLEFLRSHNLAWPSFHTHAYGHRTWHALHPVLGSAVMTTLGLAIAREQHYDVVTPSNKFHETLLATREDAIFEKLLSSTHDAHCPTLAQARSDLGQLVITLAVNLEALRPEDIPELQASKSFQQFQRVIRTKAQMVSSDDPEIYAAQLASEAQDIIDAWHATKVGLSAALKSALYGQASNLSVEVLKALLKNASVPIRDLVVGGGLAIGISMTKALWGLREDTRGPYGYLTEVVRAENEFLRMTFPLGIERG